MEGTVTLRQKWNPYLSDPKSQDYSVLASAVVNAVRNLNFYFLRKYATTTTTKYLIKTLGESVMTATTEGVEGIE